MTLQLLIHEEGKKIHEKNKNNLNLKMLSSYIRVIYTHDLKKNICNFICYFFI